jgi:hypothetical protein
MGVSESTPDPKLMGFRIYKVSPHGPLWKKDVKPIEDFLIPPDEIQTKKIPFYEWVKKNANQSISLNFYSLRKRHFYTLDVTPCDDWCPDKNGGFLGACVRYENWSTADSALVRVLKVSKGSLAEKIGLISQEDFIVAIRPEGEDIISLNKSDVDALTIFTNLLGIYRGKNIELFVYNTKTGAKYVNLNFDSETLGCEVAYGKLHEFPKLMKLQETQAELEIDKSIAENKEATSEVKISNNDNRDSLNEESKNDLSTGLISQQIEKEKEVPDVSLSKLVEQSSKLLLITNSWYIEYYGTREGRYSNR